jgi:NADH-quinone oxidoreductase subunit H
MGFEPIKILYAFLTVIIVLNIGLVLQGVTRKIAARVGGRYGIRWYQPYIDLVKNYAIRTSVHHGVMFWLGPVFRLAGGMGVLIFIPAIYGSEMFSNFSFAGDMMLVLYFIFFGTLGMALGAGESGHPYSAIGVSRGLAQVTAAEIPMLVAIMATAIQYHSLSVTDIVAAQQGGFAAWTAVTNPVLGILAVIAYLGSMMRSPFDVVLAPQEIPIGPPTEFHGTFLALLQTNRNIFPVAKTILFVNLFFGGATNWPMMILKAFLLYMTSVIVGSVMARFRVDQSIRWFYKYGLPLGLITLLVTILMFK